MSNRIRIYMTGVGGQGNAYRPPRCWPAWPWRRASRWSPAKSTVWRSAAALWNPPFCSAGWKSPKLGFGEADIVLGFEPLETLRGLRYLKQGGVVFSSTDVIPPLSVSAGREVAPGLDAVEQAVRDRASSAWFLPCRSMGIELGSAQCGNNILLGALCASGLLPFGFEALEEGIRTFMPAKLVDVNLKAAERGREILASSRLF